MGCRRSFVLFAAAAVLFAGPSLARLAAQQTTAMCHMQEMSGIIDDPATLRPPVEMTGIGNSSIAITAANKDAKMWFTQGLNLLHDFWDYEAARAFEQAVRSDPKCAMCYWGLYRAASFRGTGNEWGAEALSQAVLLSGHVTRPEQIYIEAAVESKKAQDAQSTKKTNESSPKKESHEDSEETKALRKLVAMKPDDIQARIFLAESLDSDIEDGEGQRILAEVLKQHPDDSAANHYWIHAVEPGEHPERALESAKKLAALAPNSGHMVHMPGHIYYLIGDYETAREAFLASMHVDEAYMKTQQVTVANDWNYVHNLMYLIADLAEGGRLTEATSMSAKLTAARGVSGPTLYRQVPRDGLSRLDVRLPVMLRSGAWEAATRALEKSSPDADLKNLALLREAMLHYTRGMAALERGEKAQARRASDALAAYVKTNPDAGQDAMPQGAADQKGKDALAQPVHSFVDIASMELEASVLLAEGRGVESAALFTKAVEAEHQLRYREPPTYIRPVEETRGDALLRARLYDDAKSAYEAELKRRPGSGYALFGIAQADAAAHRPALATTDYARLMQAWAQADSELPQLQAARAWMAQQSADGE